MTDLREIATSEPYFIGRRGYDFPWCVNFTRGTARRVMGFETRAEARDWWKQHRASPADLRAALAASLAQDEEAA